ncbi:P-loop containing nucleoside triphosphate hydrolase protein [Dipodascopsis uninucleata]
MHAIRMRYQQLSIYTYSGIVLIATNPFQRIDSLYSPDIIQMYSGKRRGELEPHLFAIAEDAYRCMIRDSNNQTIVVSGESGAGKTVSAKYIMRYFATVEDSERPRKHSRGSKGDILSETEQQILATNPIMEAFGNAKTTRNDNSSRFGKYIAILFSDKAEIIGAKIRTYLLERSRLVFQPATERNYHIFYQLCAGATDEEREALGLVPVTEFAYLNQGGDAVIPNVDDAAEFQVTKDSLGTIGVNADIQKKIFEILAALLHIGNITITAGRTDATLHSTEPSLVRVCELLGIDSLSFAKWITKKQIVTRSEKIVTSLNYKQAVVVRDSVSKFIYSALFDWLVFVINKGLASPEVEKSVKSFIGVLDIYGFEHFKQNSFEQFCINYANEKLQQEFNQHVFKLEQDEYVREAIEWTFIEYSDNQPCIDLIEARIGILSLLDEESRLPSGSDESWINKLYTNFDVDKHKNYFKKPRFGKSAFTIHHYAMDVTYESAGFIEKNRDTVPDEHMDLLLATKNDFLKEVIQTSIDINKPEIAASTVKGRPGTLTSRKPTLGGIFKGSLIELMNTINSTNVHYIRCIKPNEGKEAWKFEGPMVLSQLRACGVLETIRISCEGFPTRWTFEEFVGRYYMLVHSSNWTKSITDIANEILKSTITQPDRYQLGKTKIFFRAGMLAYLENLRSQRLNDCAVLIQKNLKRLYFRNRYLEIRKSIIQSQAIFRGYLVRARIEKLRLNNAATKIQSAWRRYYARKCYLDLRNAVVKTQAILRGHMVRKGLLHGRQERAVTTIQRTFRGYIARKDFKADLRKIIIIQSLFRRRQAFQQLKDLKVEARSANHYKEVSYKLENKVVELTQTLATRTEENKKLLQQIEQMETHLSAWQEKHNELQAYTKELEAEAETANEHMKHAQALESKLSELNDMFQKSASKMESLESESETLRKSLTDKSNQLAEAMSLQKQKEESVNNLNEEIEKLKEEIEKLSTYGPATGAYINGNAMNVNSANRAINITSTTKLARSLKRHSLNTTLPAVEPEVSQMTPQKDFSPRPASMAAPPTSPGYFAAFGDAGDDEFYASANIDEEIEKILDSSDVVNMEVAKGLVESLKIPQLSSHSKATANEVLFPAHIINLITFEMWRLGFVKESEVFLALVMQSIQEKVMSFSGDEIISPGAFWLSNVHEMYSFVVLAERNVLENENSTSMSESDLEEYERLVSLVKHDLENLEFNIYHTWMKELKRMLHRMIVPAVIESQSLPGFITNEGNRFFSKILNPSNTPQYSMDDLLNLLNKIYKAMEVYYLEDEVVRQVVIELLKLVGVVSFNDLLMRRNFLSWKRGLQISYNITRIEEWCKSHEVPEGTLKLEHLMQATKLLQLKKASIKDLEIIYDICWTLTPAQVQKLFTQYHVADYEAPISSDILKAIANKAMNNGNDVLLLETVPLDDSGPFEIVEPRQLAALETYIPSWLQVPTLKKLVDLTLRNSSKM